MRVILTIGLVMLSAWATSGYLVRSIHLEDNHDLNLNQGIKRRSIFDSTKKDVFVNHNRGLQRRSINGYIGTQMKQPLVVDRKFLSVHGSHLARQNGKYRRSLSKSRKTEHRCDASACARCIPIPIPMPIPMCCGGGSCGPACCIHDCHHHNAHHDCCHQCHDCCHHDCCHCCQPCCCHCCHPCCCHHECCCHECCCPCHCCRKYFVRY